MYHSIPNLRDHIDYLTAKYEMRRTNATVREPFQNKYFLYRDRLIINLINGLTL